MNGVCVIVGVRVVAWFENVDHAEEWATEHYFGQWLIVPAETGPTRAELRVSKTQIDEIMNNVQEARRAA